MAKIWRKCRLLPLSPGNTVKGMSHLPVPSTQIFSGPVCGNSVVEEGEECDCGLYSDCTNSCCQADTCTLRPGAACADGACCLLSSCSLAAPLTQCRPAAGECDLPEVCDGQSPLCPPDDHLASGLPCSHGFCHSGHCASHLAQCQLLWGQEARPSHPRCFSLNTRGDHQVGLSQHSPQSSSC